MDSYTHRRRGDHSTEVTSHKRHGNPSRETLRNRFAHVLTGSPLAKDVGLIQLLVDAATRIEGKGYLGDDDE